ncbi:cob(I)yrinic acid a,c-diamide adenosyltransferase [Candidatus Woesearchaeota archaeon]|nr:cob(I)yrinic acid a,c-diamide adenosyltransferase [Candidatus Woesearchaeota archaeon]
MVADDPEAIRQKLGLVHVYTGNGKGKTTAALGLAMRALEHGLNVSMLQFLKGGLYIGELSAPSRFSGKFSIEQFGKGSEDEPSYEDFSPDDADRERALRGLARARELLSQGQTDVLILDEVHVALQLRHLTIEEVLSLVREKPDNVELVLTGRYAPREIIAVGDYVTEMHAHEHPYNKGILGRKGIDY